MNRNPLKSALTMAAFTPAAVLAYQKVPVEFDSDVAKNAVRILAAYEKHGLFDGAVLLATKGKVVFKKRLRSGQSRLGNPQYHGHEVYDRIIGQSDDGTSSIEVGRGWSRGA